MISGEQHHIRCHISLTLHKCGAFLCSLVGMSNGSLIDNIIHPCLGFTFLGSLVLSCPRGCDCGVWVRVGPGGICDCVLFYPGHEGMLVAAFGNLMRSLSEKAGHPVDFITVRAPVSLRSDWLFFCVGASLSPRLVCFCRLAPLGTHGDDGVR